MSAWSSIAHKLKEMISNMIGSRTIEQTLNVSPVISAQMEEAIQMWSNMYKGQAPWLREPSYENPVRITSLGLPSMIASEKARMALLELSSEISTPTEEVEVENPNYQPPEPDEFGNLMPTAEPETIIEDKPVGPTERAEFLESQYKKLKKQLRRQIEYGIAKGGLVIKPYVIFHDISDESANETDQDVAEIEFDFIQADAFYPLAFDASGKITEAAFIQTKTEKNIIYRRLEYHKWANNVVRIQNKAFKSTTNTNGDSSGIDLGKEVALTEIPEWKDLQPSITIKNVTRPLFAYFKMPEANTVDTTSPLGVSGYSRVVNLIKDADMQYSRLLWEYEGGELAVNIDRDAFTEVKDARDIRHTVLNHMQSRLYRRVDMDTDSFFEPYAPSLRDASYTDGLNTILMRIEDACGISRGTLSDPAAEAKTATELKILKQRSYQTNADIQEAIEDAVRDTIYVMNTYCDLYELAPDGEYDVSFEWDDSLLTDVDEELNKRLTLLQSGLASKLELRMWYFGETERQAQEALTKINGEALQSMEQEYAIQSNQFKDKQ